MPKQSFYTRISILHNLLTTEILSDSVSIVNELFWFRLQLPLNYTILDVTKIGPYDFPKKSTIVATLRRLDENEEGWLYQKAIGQDMYKSRISGRKQKSTISDTQQTLLRFQSNWYPQFSNLKLEHSKWCSNL